MTKENFYSRNMYFIWIAILTLIGFLIVSTFTRTANIESNVTGIYYFGEVDSLYLNDAKIKVSFMEAKINSSKIYVKFNPKHTLMGEILEKYSKEYNVEVIRVNDLESNLQNEEENSIIIFIDK